MGIIQDAAVFAYERHKGQKRKCGADYFHHLDDVAGLLRVRGLRDQVVAAGYLHDVIEDKRATRFEVHDRFGDEIARLVMAVTNPSAFFDVKLTRPIRHMIDMQYLAGAAPDAQSIKAADIASNSVNIIEIAPDFAPIYIPEQRAKLSVLTNAHYGLVMEADRRLRRQESALAATTAG